MLEDTLIKQRLMPKGHWDWHVSVPFSQGWRVGDFVFVGGQLSMDQDGNVIGVGDIEVQTRNVYKNIGLVLKEAGSCWSDVIKLNTYYVFNGSGEEIQEFWLKMTQVRLEFLPEPGPAATAVRVAGLMYDNLLIEADVIAHIARGNDKGRPGA